MSLKELKFVKINPSGNITLLYHQNNIIKDEFKAISKVSMTKNSLDAEQVGFINTTHLEMMGGEFCGNACRSFGAFLAFNDDSFKDKKIYTITCSGESTPLNLEITGTAFKNRYFAKIKMPNYIATETIVLNNYQIYIFYFSGITHFIVESKEIDNFLLELIHNYCKNYGILNFGVMFFDSKKLFMIPYVYIEGIGGTWENSCASGTSALGFYLNTYKNIDSIKINQPGGFLIVSIENSNIFIDGPVDIVAEGTSYINIHNN